MLEQKGSELFRKNAGVIAKPEELEFHWLAELTDGTQIKMYDEFSSAGLGRCFDIVKDCTDQISYVVWIGVNNQSLHFGVAFNGGRPIFMVAGKLISPVSSKYYNGHTFTPNLFIRNTILLPGTIAGPDWTALMRQPKLSEKSMSYFAGFKFTYNNAEEEMYFSWDGVELKAHGFESFEEVGGYNLV